MEHLVVKTGEEGILQKNKTSTETLTHIRQHIESFPVMESHYQRKNTRRKFLSQDLSVTKMYDLYKAKCEKDGVTPASHYL